MKFKLFTSDGTSSSDTDLPNFPSLEDGKGVDALRQCLLAVRANQRQGNASTKTRDEVSGSGKKIYRQKGLGTGRAGEKRAIQRRGGGIAFGPKPRSYSQKLNDKMRKLALTRALVDHATDGGITLIEHWKVPSHKTKEFASLLKSIDERPGRLLLVSEDFEPNLRLAARNLVKVRLSNAVELNATDLLSADKILCSLQGMNRLIDRLSPNSDENQS